MNDDLLQRLMAASRPFILCNTVPSRALNNVITELSAAVDAGSRLVMPMKAAEPSMFAVLTTEAFL